MDFGWLNTTLQSLRWMKATGCRRSTVCGVHFDSLEYKISVSSAAVWNICVRSLSVPKSVNVFAIRITALWQSEQWMVSFPRIALPIPIFQEPLQWLPSVILQWDYWCDPWYHVGVLWKLFSACLDQVISEVCLGSLAEVPGRCGALVVILNSTFRTAIAAFKQGVHAFPQNLIA